MQFRFGISLATSCRLATATAGLSGAKNPGQGPAVAGSAQPPCAGVGHCGSGVGPGKTPLHLARPIRPLPFSACLPALVISITLA